MADLSNVRVDTVADIPCATGENPLWHTEEARLYWTDIPNARIHRARPGGTPESFDVGAPTGGFTIQENGDLLLFMARGAIRTWRDGQFTGTLRDATPGEEDSRFNDVIADPAGRVFCGTMSSPSHAGRLYRLDPDGTLVCLVEGMGTPNGMGFSGDRRFFYQQDSRACDLYRFRYDEPSGALRDRETLVHVDRDAGRGRPDGMTVDRDDCIWSARWDGARIVRYSPDGVEIGEVPVPFAKKTSCITFGGPAQDTAYVTTAGGDDRDENGDLAGSVLRFDPGVRGRPEYRSRIRL